MKKGKQKAQGNQNWNQLEEQESSEIVDGEVPILGTHKDRHCGHRGQGTGGHTQGEDSRDSGGGMWCQRIVPTPSSTQTQQGSTLLPIRSPARATAFSVLVPERRGCRTHQVFCPESLPRGQVPPPCCLQLQFSRSSLF